MAADIDAEDFLLISQKLPFLVFRDIRERYSTRLPVFSGKKVKDRHLPRNLVFFLFLDGVENPRVGQHLLPAVSAERVKSACLNEIFHRSLIQVRSQTFGQIAQICIRTSLLSPGNQRLNHRSSDGTDGVQPVTDASRSARFLIGYGESALPLIDVRRQNTDAHAPAGHDIFRDFSGIVNHGGHQGSHEFHRIIVFQPGSLKSNHSVCGGMGLIEGIFREICHLIIDFVRSLLVDPVGDAAGNAFVLIAVYKVFPLLSHDRGFFLGHGAPDIVALSQIEAPERLHDLHDLLLIDNAAVGRLKDRLQERRIICDGLRMIFPADILGDKVHRARPVKGNAGDQVLQAPGPELLHETLHSRGFQLEDTVALSCRNILIYLRIRIIDPVDIDLPSLSV